MNKFGDKLFELRTKAGLSQEKLGEKIEVSRQAISNWERGSVVPDMVNIIKLSDFFGISVDYLIAETDIISETSVTLASPSRKEHSMKYKLFILLMVSINLLFMGLTVYFGVRIFSAHNDRTGVETVRNSFFNLSELDCFIIFAVLFGLSILSITIVLIKNKLNKRRKTNV